MFITPLINRHLNCTKMHFLSRFGDSSLYGWQFIVRTSSKWGKIRFSRWIWPWSPRSITPQNNRHLNQGVLHLCFKFGDSSLNGWLVIVRTSKWLLHTHTDRYTDRGDDNTRRPKLASDDKSKETKGGHFVPLISEMILTSFICIIRYIFYHIVSSLSNLSEIMHIRNSSISSIPEESMFS